MITLVSLAHIHIPEKLVQVRIIRLIVESQSADVVEVGAKFWRIALAQILDWDRELLLGDLVVLLLLVCCPQPLPAANESARKRSIRISLGKDPVLQFEERCQHLRSNRLIL